MKQLYIITFLVFLIAPFIVDGQGVNTRFGKNRIQFKQLEWAMYETETIDAYFYIGGRDFARYSIIYGEDYLNQLQQKLDYRVSDKITIYLYNSWHDLLQSNLLITGDGIEENFGGYTPLHRNKLFLAFSGNYHDLDRDLKSGLAKVLIYEMMFGGNLTEQLQNEILISLPRWYVNGLSGYFASGSGPFEYELVREGILSGRFSSFNSLTDEEADLAAMHVWQYIAENYGIRTIANILYQVRIMKSMESGFGHVLGKSFRMLYREWHDDFLLKIPSHEEGIPGNSVGLKNKISRSNIIDMSVSPGGNKIAFFINEKGKQQVWVHDLLTGEASKIYSKGRVQGPNEAELTYPVGAWNTDGSKLGMAIREKNYPVIIQYDMEEGKWDRKNRVILDRLDNILSFDYIDRRNVVISGVRRGQTDLFLMNLTAAVLRPVTNDLFNQLNVRYAGNGIVVFNSNMPEGQMPGVTELISPDFKGFSHVMNGFYCNITKPGYPVKRLSFNTSFNSFSAEPFKDGFYSILTDEGGFINRKASYPDSIFQYIQVIAYYHDAEEKPADTLFFFENDTSAIQINPVVLSDTMLWRVDTAFVYKDTAYIYPLTSYSSNITHYTIDLKSSRIYELFSLGSRNTLRISRFPENIPEAVKGINPNLLKTRSLPPLDTVSFFKEEVIGEIDSVPVDTLYFQSEFLYRPEEVLSFYEGMQDKVVDIRHTLRGAKPYFPRFTPDHIITQVSNSYFVSPYLPYQPGDKGIFSTAVDGIMKIGLSDDFMDHRIIGGFRLSGQLEGINLLLHYQNLKKRWNKEFLYYRSSERGSDETTNSRSIWNEGRLVFSYPFSRNSRIEFRPFARHEQLMHRAVDQESLEMPVINEIISGGKIAFIFDQTIPAGLNLYRGSRFTLYTEGFNNFTTENSAVMLAGGDFRYYLPILSSITWANRLAFESSFGNAHVVYILGGVENWMAPRFHDEIIIDRDINYRYKFQATQMRGFMQNIRNGTSYALFNSELRIPVFRIFSKRPLNSKFFQNFQVVGFGDMGSAWMGSSPYSEENIINTQYIERGPITIKVQSLREPVVGGYGIGFRSTLLGYFLKLDFSWGVENGEVKYQNNYFSIGLDF